jgi:hypothetical protein
MASLISAVSRRACSTVCIAAAVSVIAAIGASAASAKTTWFGSSLNHTPANAGSSCSDDGVGAPGDVCTHVGSDYPGTSGRAKAPVKGTITQLKLRPEGPLTFVPEVVSVRDVASDFQSGQARATARGHQVSLPGPTQDQMSNGIYPVVSVHVKLKVKKGQEIAINTASNTAEYCSDGTPGQLLFDPVLAPGSSAFHASQGVDGCLMLVQAKIKH